MATARLKKHIHTLHCLNTKNAELRRAILATADDALIRCICDCCHNVLKGNVKLTPKQKKSLNRYKKIIRNLASENTPLEEKRGFLIQKGGFLPALLGPILAVATGLLGSLIKNG